MSKIWHCLVPFELFQLEHSPLDLVADEAACLPHFHSWLSKSLSLGLICFVANQKWLRLCFKYTVMFFHWIQRLCFEPIIRPCLFLFGVLFSDLVFRLNWCCTYVDSRALHNRIQAKTSLLIVLFLGCPCLLAITEDRIWSAKPSWRRHCYPSRMAETLVLLGSRLWWRALVQVSV